MNQDLSQKAVSAALSGNWDKAEELNKLIIKAAPQDVDALNRLAKAYVERGNINLAKQTASKVTKIDPFNKIALKSLEKWKRFKKSDKKFSTSSDPLAFLEEPGKTKVVTLLSGSSKVITTLDAGNEVKLSDHGHRMSVVTLDSKYLGRLPDDLSARLKKLISYGNEYKVFVKSVDKKDVKVFIREVKRAKKLADIPSFSTEKIDYISFTPPELVHKDGKVDMNNDEEDDG